MFKLEGFKPFGWYLTLVQFAFYGLFGLIQLQFKADKQRRYTVRIIGRFHEALAPY